MAAISGLPFGISRISDATNLHFLHGFSARPMGGRIPGRALRLGLRLGPRQADITQKVSVQQGKPCALAAHRQAKRQMGQKVGTVAGGGLAEGLGGHGDLHRFW
jgi:hypothetical protein